MKASLAFLILLLLTTFGKIFPVNVELRNIVSIDGFTENPVVGYGIVVGLKGTGDSEKAAPTREMITAIADNFGFAIDPSKIKPKNSAIVMVSATIRPFSSKGSRMNVKISSIYDAKSLEGGELLPTPLLGGDNELYVLAQGALATDKNQKGVNAVVNMGGIVQKEIVQKILNPSGELQLSIQDSLGFGAVAKVYNTLRKSYPDQINGVDNNKIRLKIPSGQDVSAFLAELLSVKVDVDDEPSIIIDSRSGIVVYGGSITLSEAAVSFKGTEVSVGSSSAFGAFSSATDKSKSGPLKVLKESVSVTELVNGLNEIGATTEDIIKILELLRQNGNLKAKLTIQ